MKRNVRRPTCIIIITVDIPIHHSIRLHSNCRACAQDAWTPQSQCVHPRLERDVKRLPCRGFSVSLAQISFAVLVPIDEVSTDNV